MKFFFSTWFFNLFSRSISWGLSFVNGAIMQDFVLSVLLLLLGFLCLVSLGPWEMPCIPQGDSFFFFTTWSPMSQSTNLVMGWVRWWGSWAMCSHYHFPVTKSQALCTAIVVSTRLCCCGWRRGGVGKIVLLCLKLVPSNRFNNLVADLPNWNAASAPLWSVKWGLQCHAGHRKMSRGRFLLLCLCLPSDGGWSIADTPCPFPCFWSLVQPQCVSDTQGRLYPLGLLSGGCTLSYHHYHLRWGCDEYQAVYVVLVFVLPPTLSSLSTQVCLPSDVSMWRSLRCYYVLNRESFVEL